MTTSIDEATDECTTALDIVAGVDTHADTHHVAILDMVGRRVGDRQIRATAAGYEALLTYLESFG
jgi:hypothetical protein